MRKIARQLLSTTRKNHAGKFGGQRYTGSQRISVLSPRREVPSHIVKPDYCWDGIPKSHTLSGMSTKSYHVHTPEEIACAREAGRITREVLDIAGQAVRPGLCTDEIDRIVHHETIQRGAYPSPLNYMGFPKSVCTSVNEVVCHGIPGVNIFLKEGDTVNIDVSCYFKSFHGDCSETFCVGDVADEHKRAMQVAYDAWQAGIAVCRPGVDFCEIGGAIERHAWREGKLTAVRNFSGHGVGRSLHLPPLIVHYENKNLLGPMLEGHMFTIEPMLNEGSQENFTWKDGWTVATEDGRRSVQFEHTFLVTATGLEALTGKTERSPRYFWERSTGCKDAP